jgi:hypothetical protein
MQSLGHVVPRECLFMFSAVRPRACGAFSILETYRLERWRLRILDRPVKPGDDIEIGSLFDNRT